MKIEVKSYSNIALLISSIVFFILGAVMFTRPDAIVLVVSYVIGGLIILLGIFNCIKNYIQVKNDNRISSKGMVLGIVLVVVGLVFIFLAGVIEALVRLVIGGWILFSGINRLINALYLDKKSVNFYVMLVLALLLIGGGLYTILETNLVFKYLGIVLMVYSTLEIIGYIFNKKNDNTKTSPKTIEASIVEVKKIK